MSSHAILLILILVLAACAPGPVPDAGFDACQVTHENEHLYPALRCVPLESAKHREIGHCTPFVGDAREHVALLHAHADGGIYYDQLSWPQE